MLLQPAQSLEKLFGHGQSVILYDYRPPTCGYQGRLVIIEVHIIPTRTEKLAAPRSQMKIGQ